MEGAQFQAFRAAVAVALVQVPEDMLGGPAIGRDKKPTSRAWRVAVTSNEIARACAVEWKNQDRRESERVNGRD